jgi:hypothetical protein
MDYASENQFSVRLNQLMVKELIFYNNNNLKLFGNLDVINL